MWRLSTFSALCSSAALRMIVWCCNQQLARRPGQGLVEYGLVLVLVMVVCVGILTMVGTTVSSVWYDKLIPAFK
jgi:hypothetical protein